MKEPEVKSKNSEYTDKAERQPHRVRLPGFITDEDIGLGNVIKRVTSTIGMQPCDGCAERASALNHWLVFYGRPRR